MHFVDFIECKIIKYKRRVEVFQKTEYNVKKQANYFLNVLLEKDVCHLPYSRALNTKAMSLHPIEAGLVALFHQLQFIPGYSTSVSAGQKPGSDGKICKASSHPKGSSHAHLVQVRAE